MRDFEGKVIVVTGAGGGVGTALCRQFAERGGTIIAVGRTAAKLESTLAIVRGLGSQILMITGDITRAETAARVADACASLGGVDVLINNAAVGYSYEKMHPGSMARLGDQTPDLWRDVVDINLTGPAAITQALLPKLLERREGANVVFISSILSLRGHSNAHAYSAAKAGINNLVQSLAVSYGPAGLRTNCVAPGLIDTAMAEPIIGKDRAEGNENPFAHCPLGRAATVNEVASAVLFLASPLASYINGAVLAVDGGSSAKI